MSIEQEAEWLEHSAGVCVLEDRAIITVSGDDARDWLQGQLTNQLAGAEPGDSVYGFVLTLKGRVLADAWALVREFDVWLDVPRAQVDVLLERLDRYIIMEDVDLERRDDLHIITAQGPRASRIGGDAWPSDRLGVGGRLWVVAKSNLSVELERITSEATALDGGAVSPEAWAHAHVTRGRPRFGVDFGDQTYPQESGLTSIAVSFSKGCYIGQETVMMLQNRGKAPKVLWRWRVDGPSPPARESVIMSGESNAGEVTSAVRAGTSNVALGFVKRGHEADDPAAWTIGGERAEPTGPVEEGPGVGRVST